LARVDRYIAIQSGETSVAKAFVKAPTCLVADAVVAAWI